MKKEDMGLFQILVILLVIMNLLKLLYPRNSKHLKPLRDLSYFYKQIDNGVIHNYEERCLCLS